MKFIGGACDQVDFGDARLNDEPFDTFFNADELAQEQACCFDSRFELHHDHSKPRLLVSVLVRDSCQLLQSS
jgi:hypothetical protein